MELTTLNNSIIMLIVFYELLTWNKDNETYYENM